MELLAPAGDPDCAAAAAAAGADAVYLGLPDFSARRRAGNVATADLARVVAFLHRRRVRAYLAVNTLLCEDELERFAASCAGAAAAGVDAFIVQDLGGLRLLRAACPGVPLHLSTQAALFDIESIRAAAALGAARVVLPRELPLGAIRGLARASPLELECFVHGALCSAVSGRCLLSSRAGGRSGNRGLCAQCCRLEYSTGARRGRLLSAGDLCLIGDLRDLAAAGVKSFKIEGRLKKSAYVGLVVAAYRAAMDDPRRAGEAAALLERAYHRPFTRGYLDGPHPALARPDERGNEGVEAGEVLGYDPARRMVRVRLSRPLKAGDGVDLRGRGRAVGQALPPMRRDGRRTVAAAAGETVEFPVKAPCFAGDRLFVTRTDELEAGFRAQFPMNEPAPGRPARLALRYEAGALVLCAPAAGYEARLDVAAGPARDAATDPARVAETLGTFDGEAGLGTEADLALPDGLFVPLAPLKKAVRAFKAELARRLAARAEEERAAALARARAARGETGGAEGRGTSGGGSGAGPPLFLLEAPLGELPAGFDARVAAEPAGLRLPRAAGESAGWRVPVLNAAAALELSDMGYRGFAFTPEARAGDLLALPVRALAAGDVCAFGRVPLAEIRHDLGDLLPPGPGPHRLASRDGDLFALRCGAATTLYAAGFFSLLSSLPDLFAAGARRFRFLFPLLDDAEREAIGRLGAAAPALKAALASGDRAAWSGLVATLLSGCGAAVTERPGRLE